MTFFGKPGDEKCILNAEKVKNYAKKKLTRTMGHFCVQGRKRDGKVILTIKKDSGIAQPTKWYRDSRNVGRPVFKSTGALSRGILKQKKGRNIFHFNGDPVNTELLFQTVSFGESAQCLCSCNGLVLSIRFDKREEVENDGISSEPGTWKQDARMRELPSMGKDGTIDTIM